jgi:transcriptional repressor NrdR
MCAGVGYSTDVNCPQCRSEDTGVIDSRLTEEGKAVRRRRECAKCQHRFTTFERQEAPSLIVIKRDGTREPFVRDKLQRGIWLSCTKRPITQEQVDTICGRLEEKWRGEGAEVDSKDIGKDVMKELRTLDQVAYIRYASIHREFKDVEEFKEEVGKLFKR